jgi:hypothetical protein
MSRLPLALVLFAGACDDGMNDPGPDDTPRGCAAETRADTYALGMAKQGMHAQVAFVDASPAPPERGDNTWRVAISKDGAPQDDVAIEVEPYMPDHMHGSSIAAHVMPTDVAGEYVITPVNMFMPGLWQVTLYLTLPDGTEDLVEFDFCVDP